MKDSEFAVRIGTRIREVRTGRGLTQSQLGDLCKLPKEQISRLESGNHLPTLKTVRRVAGAMGLKVIDLLDVESPPNGRRAEK